LLTFWRRAYVLNEYTDSLSLLQTMTTRTKIRNVILAMAGIFLIVALADSMGVFDNSEYTAVPHGNHVHYVPKDRDRSVSVGQFPTAPPGPNERIMPDGRVVAR
jgi:hypothetical protein